MSHYQDVIRQEMARMGRVGAADPRHVEAWMRVEHGTLNGLSPRRFAKEVSIALGCIAAASTQESESLAQSFGL